MTTKTEFDYEAAAKRVVLAEARVTMLASDYQGLVKFTGLSESSTSKEVTEAARAIVIDGSPKTAHVTLDDLKGRDPGADAAKRPYWLAARQIRIGLVTAIGAERPDKQVDWLGLVGQAALNATNHDYSIDAVIEYVTAALMGETETVEMAA